MAKDNKLVTRTRFSNSLRNELLVAFNELKADTKINKSVLLDEAIELLLKKYNRPIPPTK